MNIPKTVHLNSELRHTPRGDLGIQGLKNLNHLSIERQCLLNMLREGAKIPLAV